nr:MAG TPA: hypothetical protein [Caudoviricetes sp.]
MIYFYICFRNICINISIASIKIKICISKPSLYFFIGNIIIARFYFTPRS